MVRLLSMVVVLVGVGFAPAYDPAPTGLVGTWTRKVGPSHVTLKFTERHVTASVEVINPEQKDESFTATLEADYSVSSDGMIYGYLTAIDADVVEMAAELQQFSGQPFAMKYRCDERVLSFRDVKGFGVAADADKDHDLAEITRMIAGRYERGTGTRKEPTDRKKSAAAAPQASPIPMPLTRTVEVMPDGTRLEKFGIDFEPRVQPVQPRPIPMKGAVAGALVGGVTVQNLPLAINPPMPLPGQMTRPVQVTPDGTVIEVIGFDLAYPIQPVEVRNAPIPANKLVPARNVFPSPVPTVVIGGPSMIPPAMDHLVPATTVSPSTPSTGITGKTWTRESAPGYSIELTLTERRLSGTMTMPFTQGRIQKPLTVKFDGDLAVSPDGQYFGVLTAIDVPRKDLSEDFLTQVGEVEQAASKLMYRFRVRVDQGQMTMTECHIAGVEVSAEQMTGLRQMMVGRYTSK